MSAKDQGYINGSIPKNNKNEFWCFPSDLECLHKALIFLSQQFFFRQLFALHTLGFQIVKKKTLLKTYCIQMNL